MLPAEGGCPDREFTLSEPRSPVLIAGSDAAWCAAEERLAEELAAQLSKTGPPWAQLQVLRGRAEAVGEPLLVLVDAAQSLPWELLSLGDGPLESSGTGAVFRWMAGAGSSREVTPTGAVWVATDDPASATVADAARRSLAAAGLREVGLDDGPALLWLVGHGERGEHALEVALEGRRVSTAAVSARLGKAVDSATLAVVAVCHGAAPDIERRGTLVGRLLAAGVPMVLAPASAAPTELLVRLADGMAPAIARGEPLHRVVAAARREVRAWAFPQQLARWTAPRCFVSSIDTLELVLRSPLWRPTGWPAASAAAATWLAAARRDAVHRADGYVGVEHLLRVLAELQSGGPVASAVRRSAPTWLVLYDAASAALLPQVGGSSTVGVSPRLARIGEGLPEGFDIDQLATLVLVAVGAGAPPVQSGQLETLDSAVLVEPGAVDTLEVVGGPEDGRLLTVRDGEVIGRAGGDADLVLYAETRLTDRKLSRRHLTWDRGRLDSVRPVRVTGPEGPREPHQQLRHGDVVQVTAATRLRAVCSG